MNYALIWIDSLLVYLLWVATTTAFAGRIRRKWIRSAMLPIVIGFPLLTLVSFVFGTGMLRYNTGSKPDWFFYALSLMVAYLIGTAVILHQGRRREAGALPAAGSWPMLPLLVSFVIATVVSYIILLNMDMAIRARCALLSLQIGQEYWAAAPAVVSESQNAAPLYEKVFARFTKDHGDEIKNPPTGDSETFDPNEPETIAFLKRQADTIVLLRRAAELPACRFDADLQDPQARYIDRTMLNLNMERHCANILRLHAKEEIARGHAALAIADADAIKKMSRHFTQRPLLISALVGIGIDALGNATLEDALPAVKTKDDLAELHLDQLAPLGKMFQQSMRGEERLGLSIYANMPVIEWRNPHENQLTSVAMSGGVAGAFARVFFLDMDDYINLMTDLQKAATEPYHLAKQNYPQIMGENRAFGLLTRIIAPAVSRSLAATASMEASDACAEIAVAMTQFRLDHGKLPAQITDLVPKYLEEIPADLFDGKPLRLTIKNNKWIIYSVGPDGIDNGGVEMDHGKGDVIFTLAGP